MRWMLNNVVFLEESTICHNIVVKILIYNRRLSILPFHAHEGCANFLILIGGLFLMNKMFGKN